MYQRYSTTREMTTDQLNETGVDTRKRGYVREKGVDSRGEEFVVRRATIEDYQSVMDINRNIYDGLDYLQDLYFMFIHENNNGLYVVEQHSKVVSFAIYSPSQGGTQLTAMALRTHADFQGRGLSASRNEAMRRLVRQDFPHVTHEMHTRMTRDLKEDGELVINTWNCSGYVINAQEIKAIVENITPDAVKQSELRPNIDRYATSVTPLTYLSYNNCMKLLSSGELFETFFRSMDVEYFPYSIPHKPTVLSKENFKRLFGIGHLYAGFETATKATEISSLSEKEAALLRATSLSYRYVFLLKNRPFVDLFYFGGVENLRDHFVAQLRDICEICEGEIIVIVNCQKKITFSEMEELVKDMGLTEERINPFAKRLTIYMTRKPF